MKSKMKGYKNLLFSIMLLMISSSLVISGYLGAERTYASDSPYIKRIQVEPYGYFLKDWPPAIGCSVSKYRAIVHMSDGTIAEADEMKQMYWTIECYDNVEETYTTVKTDEGETVEFWMPYGTKEGQYKITAVAKVDPDASGYTWKQLRYPGYTETFCICKPGKVKYGNVTGKKPVAKDIKENYNWETGKYTSILPDCPYKAKDYTFVSWEREGVRYSPGTEYIAGYDDEPDGRNAYFTAEWKPNFKSPELVATPKSSKRIRLSWNRMVGGNGYKIYRATKKNGKYKLLKTIKNKLTTSWTDKKIKKNKRTKKYYYKVAAYKKSKGKIALKKSVWAMTSTRAAKVKSVELSKSSINGKIGNSTKIKATVKFGRGKKLSKKVRWYTSDKKVVKINSKGKITFVRKGTCQIWAKAYNGKNSSKIKVTVK